MLETDAVPDEGDEDFDRVKSMALDLCDVFDDYEAEPSEMVRALADTMACVLTLNCSSRCSAELLLGEARKLALIRIDIAEENGLAWWVNNRAN